MAGEAVDIYVRVLKESNKSRFDSYRFRNRVLNISHITFRDCCVHIFSDNLSRNSCILTHLLLPTITILARNDRTAAVVAFQLPTNETFEGICLALAGQFLQKEYYPLF